MRGQGRPAARLAAALDATEQHRLQAQIGPYTVLGRLHAPPGTEALSSLGEREVMVPLTDATIAYVIAGILEVRDCPTLIINRELASWLRDAEADPVGPPTLAAVETRQLGRTRHVDCRTSRPRRRPRR